jgi:hypothetical protein
MSANSSREQRSPRSASSGSGSEATPGA